MTIWCCEKCVLCTCSSETVKLSLVERLQNLLTTKGSSEDEVMEMLGYPALIKQLMVLTGNKVIQLLHMLFCGRMLSLSTFSAEGYRLICIACSVAKSLPVKL